MFNSKTILIKWALFLIVMLLILPSSLPPYYVVLVTECIVFSLFAVSYNLLLGYAGLLSFGHAMFFGTGAYATAVLLNHFPGLSLLGVISIASLITMAAGFIVGGLLLRHKGSYFALLTLAFNALFYALSSKLHGITGGDDGLSLTRPELNLGVTSIDVSGIVPFYYFTFIAVGLIIFYCYYFTRTGMGHTVLLMRENEERMKFMGYSTSISRLLLFTFTGMLAGMAGSFYALFFEFTSISAISIEMTTTILLITFIGGTSSFTGPVIGAFVYIFLQDYLSDMTDRWPLIMGVIFVLMVMFTPKGLSGIFASIRNRITGLSFIKRVSLQKGN